MPATQIVFVGHHKERLIESIRALREYPVAKIILAVGQQDSSGEKKARKIAEELKDELKTVFDVEIVEIDKKNVMKAALQLADLINAEKERGNDVILNVSGSLRTFAIAAYIAACVTSSKVVSSIPRYDENENEVGIEEIVEIPILPVDFPGKEQLEIISAMDGGVDSLDDLVFRLNPGIEKGSKEFRSERSRLSHHLAKLEETGLVRRKKVGRNVRIEPTGLGRIVTGVLTCRSSRT
ncbi:transcriptional regulator [Archaeoglobales archaeon]|nr:MAG: transcriptional regulator [Archaeoglobales archaeon]